MLKFKKRAKQGDIVKIIIDYELTLPDGSKYNPRDRYGIVKTVHEENLPMGFIRYDYYVEIQGKPYNPVWFTAEEVEIIS